MIFVPYLVPSHVMKGVLSTSGSGESSNNGVVLRFWFFSFLVTSVARPPWSHGNGCYRCSFHYVPFAFSRFLWFDPSCVFVCIRSVYGILWQLLRNGFFVLSLSFFLCCFWHEEEATLTGKRVVPFSRRIRTADRDKDKGWGTANYAAYLPWIFRVEWEEGRRQ